MYTKPKTEIERLNSSTRSNITFDMDSFDAKSFAFPKFREKDNKKKWVSKNRFIVKSLGSRNKRKDQEDKVV